MDELLPKMILESVQIFFVTIGVLIVVSITNQWMIIVSIILLVLVYFTRLLFLKTINPLKRIEGVSK